MAGHGLLVIHRAEQRIFDLMEPYQEDENGKGIWDYFGYWADAHPECRSLGIEWAGHNGEIETDWLRQVDDYEPPPLLTPEAEWIDRPACFNDYEWRGLFWMIVRKYPGHLADLIRYHC